MSDFHGDHECVTHHHACDCREAEFARDRETMREVAREMLNLRGPARERTVHEWASRLVSEEGERDG